MELLRAANEDLKKTLAINKHLMGDLVAAREGGHSEVETLVR